jgi:hypothetical protein
MMTGPVNQPEVHIIGEILGGTNFDMSHPVAMNYESDIGYVCKWSIDYGEAWTHLAGKQLGQTHVDVPYDHHSSYVDNHDSHSVIWSHPLDIHFTTYSLLVCH